MRFPKIKFTILSVLMFTAAPQRYAKNTFLNVSYDPIPERYDDLNQQFFND